MNSTIRRAGRLATLVLITVAGVALAGGASAAAGVPPVSASTATDQVTIMTRNGPMGTYLTDAQGRSLYRFMADTGTTSNCQGDCALAWPPVITTGTPSAGPGVTGPLATTNRSGGTQVTYAGHPLYLYVQDKAAGDTNGQGLNQFGGLWYLVAPSGDPITGTGTSTPSSSGAPSPAPATSGGGGNGY